MAKSVALEKKNGQVRNPKKKNGQVRNPKKKNGQVRGPGKKKNGQVRNPKKKKLSPPSFRPVDKQEWLLTGPVGRVSASCNAGH
jgi:hypothetical protein